tara:strand:- start:1073 stop:2404 length:1332 start_codon:yes stop_codon:yes gene_type:complete
MMRFIGFFLALVVIHPVCDAFAAGITGRFTTAAYTFERSNPDTVSQGNFRVFQSARFRVMAWGRSELSLQTYARGSLDLINQSGNDPRYRLFHGYLRWQDSKDRFVLTGGRQLVMSGVGFGRINGIRVKVALFRRGQLDTYLGTLVDIGSAGVRSWGDGHMFGSRLSTTSIFDTQLSASFYRRSRRTDPFLSPVRLAAGLGTLEIQPGEVEQQMIGFNLQKGLGSRFSVYGRWDLSTPDGVRTRRAEGVLRYHSKGLTLSGEWFYREPYIDRNSVFSLFAQSSNQELSARGNYRFNRFLGWFGEFSRVTYEGADGYRLNLGINVLNGYVGYIRRRGFGGVSDGFTVNLRYRLHRELWTSGGLHYSRFKLFHGGVDRSRILSSTIGLDYRPSRHLTLSLQGQALSQNLNLSTAANPFPGLSRDFRFYFKASTWFFHRTHREGTK